MHGWASLCHMLAIGIIHLEGFEYVFYRENERTVLGSNRFIACEMLGYYPELYSREYFWFQKNP